MHWRNILLVSSVRTRRRCWSTVSVFLWRGLAFLTRRGEFSEQPALKCRKSRTHSRTLSTWRQNWHFVCDECTKCNWIELNGIWVRVLRGPMHLGLCAPCSVLSYRSPVRLAKFHMAPTHSFLISSGSKKKKPRYIYMSEWGQRLTLT